jgi:hypothetical protein
LNFFAHRIVQQRRLGRARAQRLGHAALARRPHRLRKVRVVREARDHVPVHVRHHVAEAGQVDLVRLHHAAHRALHCVHDAHQMCPLGLAEIGELGHVRAPDHAAEARVVVLGRREDDPQHVVLPQHLATVFTAKHAFHRRSLCTGAGSSTPAPALVACPH